MWGIVVPASLAIIIFLVLLVPIDLVFHTYVPEKPKFSLRLAWLFGLVSREITAKKKQPEEKRRAAKDKKKHKRRDTRVIFGILRTRGLPGHLKELLKGIFSCFKFREVAADFTIGLGDPANTGLLFSFIAPAAVFLGSSHWHQIRVEPSFSDDAVLQGHTQGTVRLRPIRLVPPLLKFAFSLTALRIIKTLILSKWKRKK